MSLYFIHHSDNLVIESCYPPNEDLIGKVYNEELHGYLECKDHGFWNDDILSHPLAIIGDKRISYSHDDNVYSIIVNGDVAFHVEKKPLECREYSGVLYVRSWNGMHTANRYMVGDYLLLDNIYQYEGNKLYQFNTNSNISVLLNTFDENIFYVDYVGERLYVITDERIYARSGTLFEVILEIDGEDEPLIDSNHIVIGSNLYSIKGELIHSFDEDIEIYGDYLLVQGIKLYDLKTLQLVHTDEYLTPVLY